MESTIHEHLFFCEVKVTHKVTHISKCTSSFPEFLESYRETLSKKTSTQRTLAREYIQPSGYANFLYALVDAVKESKKGELIHLLRSDLAFISSPGNSTIVAATLKIKRQNRQ